MSPDHVGWEVFEATLANAGKVEAEWEALRVLGKEGYVIRELGMMGAPIEILEECCELGSRCKLHSMVVLLECLCSIHHRPSCRGFRERGEGENGRCYSLGRVGQGQGQEQGL
jgi:hypothetical protein